MYKTQTMFSVCVKSNSFLKNFASFKNKVWIITENKTYSTVPYIQGQSPESKIREYFYYIDHQGMLFLDDSKMKNFTSAYKEIDFLVFFFKRLKLNTTDRYREHFPWISLCGRERNFVRCDDYPIVFNQVIKGDDGNLLFCHNHAGSKLTVSFQPDKLWMDVENGRVYHPANEQHGSIGLVSSKTAIEFSKMFLYNDTDNYVPTHFLWSGKKYVLDSDWFKHLIPK